MGFVAQFQFYNSQGVLRQGAERVTSEHRPLPPAPPSRAAAAFSARSLRRLRCAALAARVLRCASVTFSSSRSCELGALPLSTFSMHELAHLRCRSATWSEQNNAHSAKPCPQDRTIKRRKH